jgi:alanine racemase
MPQDSRWLQRVEVSRSALAHNVREFRRLIGGRRKFLAVVKANAYGHGLTETAGICLEHGVDWLGVNSLEEGLALREAGVEAPVLVLGYVPLAALEEAVAAGLRLTVFNRRTVDGLAAAAARLKRRAFVHIKLETGTNRLGIDPGELVDFARRVKEKPGLVLEGLSSHFANIEDTTKHDYPRMQSGLFKRALEELAEAGIRVPLRHMACTASTILFRDAAVNMARVGIGLYGLWPSKETLVSCLLRKRKPVSLKPALSWKARIVQVKRVAAGAFIGYGCTFRTSRPTVVAVVPVGYSDGYDRGLSNAAHVLVRGRRARVLGRVAMNFFMVDVTDIPGVGLEDEATLIGSDGGERITADDLAALAGTINYEVVSRISPAVPRVVT